MPEVRSLGLEAVCEVVPSRFGAPRGLLSDTRKCNASVAGIAWGLQNTSDSASARALHSARKNSQVFVLMGLPTGSSRWSRMPR